MYKNKLLHQSRIFNINPIINAVAIEFVGILGLGLLSFNILIFSAMPYTLDMYFSRVLKYPLLI